MGSPGFAGPTLERLADSRHTVLAAVTNPDRPKGRGRKLAASPVKEKAQALNLPIIQPESVSDAQLQTELTALAPDLFVVVAFSILPKTLLAVPRIGSVNLHPSLLPAYRGAAPIVWAVANGEQETGISTFLLNPRVDAGDILMQRRVALFEQLPLLRIHPRGLGGRDRHVLRCERHSNWGNGHGEGGPATFTLFGGRGADRQHVLCCQLITVGWWRR